ncbi:MAG TPA: 5-formyltetrahydrofolate cyclo-ligase [Polyangia bacterium]|nr:5-formyltetrahydrofolate cyclo-ligase [Polyangia bacterium]
MAPSSSSPLIDDKRALRREMGEKRAALAEAERRARSAAATARLLALPELAAPRGLAIAGYVAAKGELDPAPALAELAASGGTVALPRVSAEAPRLRFHRADAGALAPGAYGLLEPAASAPEVPAGALDVVIAPGLAFDAEGRRLGFGGGYYDGAFGAAAASGPGAKRPLLIGLGYDFQVVARCPASAADVPVDVVVTDARVLRAPRSPAGARR